MHITAIKTRPFVPPKDSLFSLLRESFSGVKLKDKSIVVITSKIVSIWQGRCVKIGEVQDKDDLIKKEADFYIERKEVPHKSAMLTIKNNVLIPTAGIDESNGNGYFILWPENPFAAAKKIYKFIKKEYRLNKCGVIISDSHCIPCRLGTVGISIAYYGFYPLKDYRGKKDIFGREMKISRANIADALAAAAVITMGEGSEQTPVAIIEDVDFVKFKEFDPTIFTPLGVDRKDDIYSPLFRATKWKKRKTK
jgi:putative folate metabolism gamma-glutamate ligase